MEAYIGASGLSEDSELALADDDSITLITDYERIGKKAKIYELSDENQSIINADEFNKLKRIEIDGIKYRVYNGQPVSILQKREVMEYSIKQRIIGGDYVLEEEDLTWYEMCFPDPENTPSA